MAIQNVGTIEYTARINTADFKDDAAAVEEGAKAAGDSVDKNLGDGVKKAGLVVAGLGAALTVVAKKATDFATDYVKDANKLSREIGGSVEESSRLLYVTSRLGLETEGVTASFGIFSKKINGASEDVAEQSKKQSELASKLLNTKQNQADLTLQIEKTKREMAEITAEIKKNGDKSGDLGFKYKELENRLSGLNVKLHENQKTIAQLNTDQKAAVNAFEKLGISVKNADGTARDFNSIFLETADRFKGMAAGPEKTALALELFGRSGKDLLPILNLGAQGIKDLEKRADELGLTLNQNTVGAISRYIESQKQLKESTDAMKLAIGTATAPVLSAFNTKIAETINRLLATEGPVRTLTTSVLAFGGPVATVAGTALTLGASLKQIGVSGLLTAAKFGVIGIAASALSASFAYLGFNIFDTAAKTGSFTQAMNTWGGKVLQNIPIVGELGSRLIALGGIVFQQEMQQRALKTAHDATTASQQAAKLASDQLAAASLNAKGAALATEQAQKAYNQAVAQYGPNSLEARQALYNLEVAGTNQKTAVDKAAEAIKNKENKDREFAQNKEAEERLKSQQEAAERNRGAFDKAASAVAGFVRELFGIPDRKETTIKVNRETASNNPQFAGGVKNFRGGWATVGEEGAELVHLPKGSDVIPHNQSKAMLRNSSLGQVADFDNATEGTNNNTTVTINLSGIMSRSKVDEREIARTLVKRLNEELKAKNVPLLGNGAI